VATFSNHILASLSAPALAALGELTDFPLHLRERLDDRLDGSVYFPESGVVSVVADLEGKLAVELGLIGREGMVGLGHIYGDNENPYQSIVQVEGRALRADAARFRAVLASNPEGRDIALRFARAFSIQVAGTALANGRNKLEERLARWLVMVADRAGMSFAITHEFISVMLAARRRHAGGAGARRPRPHTCFARSCDHPRPEWAHRRCCRIIRLRREPLSPPPWRALMRYHLNYRDPARYIPDDEGQDFPSLDAAREEGAQSARELLGTERAEADPNFAEGVYEITDGAGIIVARVDFITVSTARRH
jgi:CRP-like cAMP-binding protein